MDDTPAASAVVLDAVGAASGAASTSIRCAFLDAPMPNFLPRPLLVRGMNAAALEGPSCSIL